MCSSLLRRLHGSYAGDRLCSLCSWRPRTAGKGTDTWDISNCCMYRDLVRLWAKHAYCPPLSSGGVNSLGSLLAGQGRVNTYPLGPHCSGGNGNSQSWAEEISPTTMLGFLCTYVPKVPTCRHLRVLTQLQHSRTYHTPREMSSTTVHRCSVAPALWKLRAPNQKDLV